MTKQQHTNRANIHKVIHSFRETARIKEAIDFADFRQQLDEYSSVPLSLRDQESKFLQTEYGAAPEEAEFAIRALYDPSDMNKYHSLNILRHDFPDYSIVELTYALLISNEEEVREVIHLNNLLTNANEKRESLYTTIERREALAPEEDESIFRNISKDGGIPEDKLKLINYLNRDAREEEKALTTNDPNLHTNILSLTGGSAYLPVNIQDLKRQLDNAGLHIKRV